MWDQGDERGYGPEIDGYRRFENYYTEFNTDKDPWTLNFPKIDGGSLAYSNLGGVNVYDGEPYDGISYLQILKSYPSTISYLNICNSIHDKYRF